MRPSSARLLTTRDILGDTPPDTNAPAKEHYSETFAGIVTSVQKLRQGAEEHGHTRIRKIADLLLERLNRCYTDRLTQKTVPEDKFDGYVDYLAEKAAQTFIVCALLIKTGQAEGDLDGYGPDDTSSDRGF